MTMTVMMMDAMTNTMVKSMYFPMRGTALEVEGISSTITSRKTVRDSRTEMERVIFSPGDTETDRDGRIYTKSLVAKLQMSPYIGVTWGQISPQGSTYRSQ